MGLACMVKKKVWGLSKAKLKEKGILTYKHTIALRQQHLACMMKNSLVEVHFDSEKNKFYLTCSKCTIKKGSK